MAFNCPHCGKTTEVETFAALDKDSRMTFSLMPKEGSLIMAGTVGGTLTNMENMLKAVGEEIGIETSVFVEGVRTDENGGLNFDLCIVRNAPTNQAAMTEENDGR